jgi:hypothetical protein
VPGEDVYTAQETAPLLGATDAAVIRWMEAGLLRSRQMSEEAPRRIQVGAEDIPRLKLVDADPVRLPLRGANSSAGVSQQTALQTLKSGQLESDRVQTGQSPAWRIHLPQGTYDNRRMLF